ncbi:MAG: glycosyltransferase [Aureliella sp.]
MDQTGQLGGAELCLLDLVLARKAGAFSDRVVLMQDGPFAQRLRESEIDVSIEELGESGRIRKESSLFTKLGSVGRVWSVSRKLAALARDYDAIYANTPKALIMGVVAAFLAKKPLVYHLHDILSASHFSSSSLRLLVAFANRSQQVIANSQASQNAYQDAGGRTESLVVYNGFDPGSYAERPDAIDAIRRELRLGEGGAAVAVFGRLAPWKGQHIAIEAVQRLEDVRLFIVGDALFEEEDYRRRLEEQVVQLGLSNRVHFLGFRSDVPELMRAFDVVIHCSTAPEPFGRVIVESMFCGTPVVASSEGGAAEILTHGETGLLASPGDVTELSEMIRQTLSDHESARERAQKAYRSAVERFQLDSVVGQINGVIDTVGSRK